MRFKELLIESALKIPALAEFQQDFDIETALEYLEEEMESIDSISIGLGNSENPDPVREAALQKDYNAHAAIETVLNNYTRSEGAPGTQVFLWSLSSSGDIPLAALMAKLNKPAIEVSWVGSIQPGEGKRLIDALGAWGKTSGYEKIHLNAKWGSSGYYEKNGFTKQADLESGVFGGAEASFYKSL